MAERLLRSGDVDTICSTMSLLSCPYASVHTGGEWAWLATECLRLLKLERDIELHTVADLPAFTGLGSSSAFTVSLLHALHSFKRTAIARTTGERRTGVTT